jgi:hypothetical protein
MNPLICYCCGEEIGSRETFLLVALSNGTCRPVTMKDGHMTRMHKSDVYGYTRVKGSKWETL